MKALTMQLFMQFIFKRKNFLNMIEFNRFTNLSNILLKFIYNISFRKIWQEIKLRMEKGKVSKKQQPVQRTENSRRPPVGFQHSYKITHPEACFSRSLKLKIEKGNVECVKKTTIFFCQFLCVLSISSSKYGVSNGCRYDTRSK